MLPAYLWKGQHNTAGIIAFMIGLREKQLNLIYLVHLCQRALFPFLSTLLFEVCEQFWFAGDIRQKLFHMYGSATVPDSLVSLSIALFFLYR